MKRRKQTDNAGFTLVELLVALTILGIIVVPFMNSFVTAAKTNAKAQQVQNATLLATNLMEEVKANSLEELAFRFNYPQRADGTKRLDIVNDYADAYELVLQNGNLVEVFQYQENQEENVNNRDYVTASVLYPGYQENQEDTYEYLGQSLGRYYFVMKDVRSGSSTYDALITLNSNEYKTVDDKGYNDRETPQIESPDRDANAFFVQSAGLDEEYAQKLAEVTKISKAILTDGNLANGEMERNIMIDVREFDGNIQVFVTYQYSYGEASVSFESVVYSKNQSQIDQFKAVYLFYMPLYTSRATKVLDQITVNNHAHLSFDFYVTKQRNELGNTVQDLTRENEYQCRISVFEEPSGNPARIILRTNLGMNLYQPTTKLPGQYVTEGNITRIMELDGAAVEDCIYDVSVKIYQAGEAEAGFLSEPLLELNGSKYN